MNVTVRNWISLLDREYLNDFIRAGGAAVKFGIPMEKDLREEIVNEIKDLSAKRDFRFVYIDSKTTKLHMVDQLFNEVARQLNWQDLARSFVINLLSKEGYQVPGETLSIRAIALKNQREEVFFRREIRIWLEKSIFRDFKMSQAFRIAMIYLCLAQLDGEGEESLFETAIIKWLRGELDHIGDLRGAHIYQKVKRHNARHMLLSLARWLKVAGCEGLVILVDASRYMIDKKPKIPDGSNYYGTVAVIDAYEVLRQFVDGTDEIEHCLMIVLSSPDFLTNEFRGVARYDALKLRIWDDVRDRHRPNPLAPLVRLA